MDETVIDETRQDTKEQQEPCPPVAGLREVRLRQRLLLRSAHTAGEQVALLWHQAAATYRDHPMHVQKGQPHVHVRTHPEAETEVFAGIFEALRHAGEELDRIADHERDVAHGHAQGGDFREAWTTRERSDTWGNLALNLRSLAGHAEAPPWDRPPLYRDADEANNRAKLIEAAGWLVSQVHEKGPSGFVLGQCVDQRCAPEVSA